MSDEIKKFTYDEICKIMNNLKNQIWENECLYLDIDFKTMKYIIDRIKKELKNYNSIT